VAALPGFAAGALYAGVSIVMKEDAPERREDNV